MTRYEVREGGSANVATEKGAGTTLFGYLPADTWTEIYEPGQGRFMERVTADAFSAALRSGRERIRVLFNHGRDTRIGSLPIATLDVAFVESPGRGLVYGGKVLEADYAWEVVPALRAGLLGSSFRFSVGDDRWTKYPERSRHNPERLPERTIRKLAIYEMGPVVFAAYPTSAAGLHNGMSAPRSMPRRFAPVSQSQFVARLRR